MSQLVGHPCRPFAPLQIPGPIRYVWYYMCCLAEEAAYQLRKRAVIAGAVAGSRVL